MVLAKERALVLTKPLNQSIGAAIHIVDTDNPLLQQQRRLAGIQFPGTSSIQGNGYNTPPKIEFEKINVIASINVKFLLK